MYFSFIPYGVPTLVSNSLKSPITSCFYYSEVYEGLKARFLEIHKESLVKEDSHIAYLQTECPLFIYKQYPLLDVVCGMLDTPIQKS